MLDRRGTPIGHQDMTRLHGSEWIEMSVQKVRERFSKDVGSHTSIVVGEMFCGKLCVGIDVLEQSVMQQRVLCHSYGEVPRRILLSVPHVANYVPGYTTGPQIHGALTTLRE